MVGAATRRPAMPAGDQEDRDVRGLVGVGLAMAALVALAAPVGATGPGKNGKLIYTTGTNIVVADANGANPTTVVPGGGFSPVWSPDGTRFVMSLGGDIWSYAA